MIGNRINAAVFATAMLLASTSLQAHHSAVMFEETKEVTFEGVVKEFQFTNPHSWLLVDVTNKDGSVTTWGFEAEGPSTLLRNGVRPADFRSGTKLTITGRPMRDGRPGALWRKAVRADGVEFYPGGRPASAARP
jgi:hypothetical protein